MIEKHWPANDANPREHGGRLGTEDNQRSKDLLHPVILLYSFDRAYSRNSRAGNLPDFICGDYGAPKSVATIP